MKLWEIKAQALRLMFADSDIQFSQTEFSDGTIYANSNTRDKLVRMTDSVRRAVDLFFQYCGNITQTSLLQLKYTEEGELYENILVTSGISGFGFPTRIDIAADSTNGIYAVKNIPFNFDNITKDVFFTDNDFVTDYESKLEYLTFLVYYKIAKDNIPDAVDEITYDLSALNIPEDIQRHIPLYVKGEIYEEDEDVLANSAKSQYIQYLILSQRQSYSKNQTKVTNKYPRSLL